METFESWSNIWTFLFIVSEASGDPREEPAWNKPRVDAL